MNLSEKAMRSSTPSRSRTAYVCSKRFSNLVIGADDGQFRQIFAREEAEPAAPRSPTDVLTRGKDGNGREPPFECRRVLDAIDLRERPCEDLVKKIGEFGVVPKQADENALRVGRVPVEELNAGGHVTALQGRNKGGSSPWAMGARSASRARG